MNTKSFLILFLLFNWINPTNAQYNFEAVEKNRMAKARVRTQTEWTHEYVSGRPAARGHISTVTRFDPRGNPVEISNFNEAGRVISLIIYQYDTRDNRVNFERYQGNREKLITSVRTVYDARGNITREHGFDGANQFNTTYTYDANGRLTEILYTENNAVTERRQLTYSGNRTEISIFNSANALTFRQVNTFNERGALVSEVRTSAQGAVTHSLNMQYNSAGNLIEEVRRRENNRLDYQKNYQYDRDNRPTRIETTSANGTKFVANEYQYNTIGDLLVESFRRNERATEPSTNRFTYDSRGLYTEKDSYFATHRFRSLYKYNYEFY